jgi:hypothetical protein
VPEKLMSGGALLFQSATLFAGASTVAGRSKADAAESRPNTVFS